MRGCAIGEYLPLRPVELLDYRTRRDALAANRHLRIDRAELTLPTHDDSISCEAKHRPC